MRRTFEFSWGSWGGALKFVGLGPMSSRVVVTDEEVLVRFGWGFKATLARAAIRQAELAQRLILAVGIHGFGGRWLINGSTRRIVDLTLEPPQRGRALGFPVGLKRLSLGLEDPQGFLEALRSR